MYEPQRTIKEVIDFETGEIIHADEFFVQTEDVIFAVRRRLEEGIQGIRTPKFGCLFCKQLIKISGRLLGRGEVVKFFSHLKDSDDCAIKTTTNLSKEEIEAIKYSGFKESERHQRLKEFIAGALVSNKVNDRGITEIKVEKTVRDEVFSFEWRRPDVASIYFDKKIVFELQLSTTFLSVVVGRDDFYRNNNTYIIWVFNFMSMNSDWQKFMEKDIYYANKRNAFVLDTEAQNQSIEKGELVLHCFWQVPIVSDDKVEIKWEDKFVTLSDLTYSPDTYKVYYIDGDLLFDEVEPEKREIILKWEAEKRERHLRLIEKSRRLYEERLNRQKERESLRLKEEQEKEAHRIDLLNKLNEGSIELMPIQKGSKWGFATPQNEVVIPCEYDYVTEFKEGLSKFRKNRRYGYINRKNEIIIPNEYIELSDFYSNHAAARKEKEWFLINDNHEIVTQLDFHDVEIVGENLIKVTRKITKRRYGGENDGGYPIYYADHSFFTGVFDFQGNEIIPFEYEDIRQVSGNKILVKQSGYWGYINLDSSIIIPFDYIEIQPFENRRAKAKNANGYWGFIDEAGNVLIPFEYSEIQTFHDGKAKAKKKYENWGFIDEAGNEVVPFRYSEIDRFVKGKARAQDNNWKFGYIDELGAVIINFIYTELEPFIKGRAKAKKDSLFGYINEKGVELIAFEYETIEQFFENRAKARKNRLWGYIDESGNELIAFEYETIEDFVENRAKARKNGLWGYIWENGEELIAFEYETIEQFSMNRAKAKKNGLWGYLDESGQELIAFEYDIIQYHSQDTIKIKVGELWGLLQFNGTQLLPLIFQEIGKISEGLTKVKRNGKWGYSNEIGKPAIRCIYDELGEFSEEEIMIKKKGHRIPVKYLAKYIFEEKRGYVDMQGREYWQYWKDERDYKPKTNYRFQKRRRW